LDTLFIIIWVILYLLFFYIVLSSTLEYIDLRIHKNRPVDHKTLDWFMSAWDKTANLFHKMKTVESDAKRLTRWELSESINKGAIRIILGWALFISTVSGSFFLFDSHSENYRQKEITRLIHGLEEGGTWRESIAGLAGYGVLEPITTTYHNISDPGLKSEILETLRNIDHGGATEALIVILKDEDPALRTAAAEALTQIVIMNVDARALLVEPLIAVLNEQTPTIREKAALGLGRIGDKRAVEPLIALLNDPDQFVRVNAAQALIKIGDERAEAPLMAAFERNDLAIIAGEPAFFIERAKAGTEPIFIAALNSFGTKETANNYLNCGNAKLYTAAIEWAKLNGYEIGSTSNRENSANWGGN
jgi:hypothetical protein